MSGTFGMTILIDWGTETLRWSAEDESFSMPNLAVSVSNRQKVCAVGNEAATLLREHPEFHALVPPRGILFADTEAIIAQLHEIRQQTVREKPWWKRLLLPRIFAAVPLGTTEFEAHGFSRILKQEEFSVLMLAAAEGYKRREIAELLGMPLPTVTWHYSRAVKKMQHALQEEREPRGGGNVDRSGLERELRREAQEHTPDVYQRVLAAYGSRKEGGGAAVRVRRRTPLAIAACAAAGVLLLLACILPFALKGSAGGRAELYISINPSVQFTVSDGRVTGVTALNRDAALLLSGKDYVGMSAEDASASFASLSAQKHLITAEGVGVYATGADSAALEARVRERLAGELGGAYMVSELSEAEFEALIAAYDEKAMGDFEDYLERELEHLRVGFADRVAELMGSYRDDLDKVFAGEMTRNAFNSKYLYLGEDLIFEDGDEEKEDLWEEFEELCSEIGHHGEEYIFDELYDEFLEAVEELYEADDGDDDDDDDDEDERPGRWRG